MSMENKIKCRLCDNSYGIKQLGMHISRTHKMEYIDYAKLYWEDLPNWSPCKNCGKICKDVYCTKECFKLGQSTTLKGGKKPPRSKEHCKKISEAAKERLKDKTNHSRYGVILTKETKEKISLSQKHRLQLNGHWATGTHLTDETKNKISSAMTGKLSGEKNGMFGKTHTPEAIEKIFTHRPMNKLEKRVADWLDEKDIKYKFQFFINENGVCKSYDFKLKLHPIIIEVHGDYWHGGSGVNRYHNNVNESIANDVFKQDLAKRCGYEVRVVWEHDINKDISVLESVVSDIL